MGKETGIQWTDHTFNPWMGCTKVSPACDHCYAEKLVTGRMGLQVWGKDAPRKETSEKYWRQPFAWDRAAERDGVRRRVFCGSLCDVMEDGAVLDRIRGDLWKLIESTPHLDWLLLTKRPQNFRRFLPAAWIESPRPNVWGMTTVESEDYLWRVQELLATPFVVRGLSCEPLLGPVDLFSYLPCPHEKGGCAQCRDFEVESGIDWVIAGGESGPGARPMHPDWARGLRDQCVAAVVPYFFKQWGEWAPKAHFAGIAEWDKASAYAFVNRNGVHSIHEGRDTPDPEFGLRCCDLDGNDYGSSLARIGKLAAGRLLDGREWSEVPSRGLSTAEELSA